MYSQLLFNKRNIFFYLYESILDMTNTLNTFMEVLCNLYNLKTVPDFLKADATTLEIKNFKEKYYNKSVIYAWVNIYTYQCYIGSAQKAQKRPFDHLRSTQNPHLKNAFTEFGKNSFLLLILEIVSNDFKNTHREMLILAENLYLSTIPRSLQYNIALFAVTGSFQGLGEEAKELIRLNITGSKNPLFGKTGSLAPGFHKKGILNHMYGKKHSLEAREKMSQIAKLRYA